MFADGSVSEVAAAVWVTGFRTDYSWLDLSGAVVDDTVADARGITGLSIVGLTWLHTPRVALLGFVKDDAAWLVDHIRDEMASARTQAAAPATCSSDGPPGRPDRR